jgi:hypothetical protein
VDGKWYSGGEIEVDSENCASFDLTGDLAAYGAIDTDASYDIVTRGWSLDLPPLPLIVTMKKEGS